MVCALTSVLASTVACVPDRSADEGGGPAPSPSATATVVSTDPLATKPTFPTVPDTATSPVATNSSPVSNAGTTFPTNSANSGTATANSGTSTANTGTTPANSGARNSATTSGANTSPNAGNSANTAPQSVQAASAARGAEADPAADAPVPETDVANLPTGDAAVTEDSGTDLKCNPQFVTDGDPKGVVIRSGAGSQFESVATVPLGHPLTVSGSQDRYVAVTVNLGTGPAKGFIDKKYLSCSAAPNQAQAGEQDSTGSAVTKALGITPRSNSKGNSGSALQPNASGSARVCR